MVQNGNAVRPSLMIGNRVSDKKEIYINDDARRSSTMVLGVKNSGKSQFVIPMFVEQDLKQKDTGMTIIVGQRDMAYLLYAMAKKARRKVKLLKPEVNFDILNQLLWSDQWDYDFINNNVIDYKKEIHEKTVIIIDMEYYHYRNNAVRAASMLILQLITDMCATQATGKRRHFVYIDDAQRYLPFLELLLSDGDSYNMSTILFFQGRNNFKIYGDDYTPLIDNNVQNTILMPGLNYDDTKYYAEKFCPKDKNVKDYTRDLLTRGYAEFMYELIGTDYVKKFGSGRLMGINDTDMAAYRKAAVKYRKSLKADFTDDVIYRKTRVREEEENLIMLEARRKQGRRTFEEESEKETSAQKSALKPVEKPADEAEKEAIPPFERILQKSAQDVEKADEEESTISGALADAHKASSESMQPEAEAENEEEHPDAPEKEDANVNVNPDADTETEKTDDVSEEEMFSRSEVDDPDKLSHSRQEEEHFDRPAEPEEKTDEKPAESDEEEEIFTPVTPVPHETEEKQEEKPDEAEDAPEEPKTPEEHEEADGEAVTVDADDLDLDGIGAGKENQVLSSEDIMNRMDSEFDDSELGDDSEDGEDIVQGIVTAKDKPASKELSMDDVLNRSVEAMKEDDEKPAVPASAPSPAPVKGMNLNDIEIDIVSGEGDGEEKRNFFARPVRLKFPAPELRVQTAQQQYNKELNNKLKM